MNKIEVSECCHADPVEDTKTNPSDHHDAIEIYTCAKCKQECDVIEVCEYCLGDGYTITPAYQSGGEIVDETRDKCICQDPNY